MGLAIGIGNGILFTSQRGVSSIIPGLIDDLCARATYCENKLCTTAILAEIAAVRYTAPALPTGLLADYPGASAAYSLRNLIDTTTSVVRVRRSSDNTEQDFTSTEITDGTLITFTGANDGFVTIWYDQSGNSNNAAQATAINQPKLVDSGVLQLDNLNPAINFSLGGSNSFTLNNRILDVQSVFQVLNAQPSTGNYKQFILGDSSSADYHSGLGELLISSQWASGPVIDGKHYINQQQYDFTSTNKPTNQSVLSLIAETPSTKVNQLTKDRGGNSSWEGKMQEIILYPTDESANKSGIEKNINTKYNIYPENTAISGLLFDYPNANAAYSLRQLTTFNTGFKPIIVKVRRSSDNTEQTFTATEITDGTLTTFTGANDGFVVTWYDQSNNMGWAKQETAANQPKIVSSGVVELENGKPTLKFNGTNKLISNNLNTNLQPNSYFMAFNFISGESIFDGNGNRNAFYQYQGDYRMFANTQAITSFSTTSGMVLSANLFNGSNSFMSLNGVLETGLNVGTSNQKGLIIGGNGTNNINGTVSEFIMYPTDQSANRTGIETNINTEYTIY